MPAFNGYHDADAVPSILNVGVWIWKPEGSSGQCWTATFTINNVADGVWKGGDTSCEVELMPLPGRLRAVRGGMPTASADSI